MYTKRQKDIYANRKHETTKLSQQLELFVPIILIIGETHFRITQRFRTAAQATTSAPEHSLGAGGYIFILF